MATAAAPGVWNSRRLILLTVCLVSCLALNMSPWVPFAATLWAWVLMLMWTFPNPGKMLPDDKGYAHALMFRHMRRTLTGLCGLPWRLSPPAHPDDSGEQPADSGKRGGWLRARVSPLSFASLAAACVAAAAAAADHMVAWFAVAVGTNVERNWWFTMPASALVGWVAAHSAADYGRHVHAAGPGDDPDMLPDQPCPAARVSGPLSGFAAGVWQRTSKIRLAVSVTAIGGLFAADALRDDVSVLWMVGPGWVVLACSLMVLWLGRRALAGQVDEQRQKWIYGKNQAYEWSTRWAALVAEHDCPNYLAEYDIPEGSEPTHRTIIFQLKPGTNIETFRHTASKLAPAVGRTKIVIEPMLDDNPSDRGREHWGLFKLTYDLNDQLTPSRDLKAGGTDEHTRGFLLRWMILSALTALKLDHPLFKSAVRITSAKSKWIYRTNWALTGRQTYADYAAKTVQLQEKLGCKWARVYRQPGDTDIMILMGAHPSEVTITGYGQHNQMLVARADWNYFLRSAKLLGSNRQPPELITHHVNEMKLTEMRFALQPGLTAAMFTAAADKLTAISGLAHIRVEETDNPKEVEVEVGDEDPLERPYMFADYVGTVLRPPRHRRPFTSWYVGVGYDGKLMRFDWDAEEPHLLVAGNTGSGKSGIINSMVCQMLHNNHPDDIEFWMMDPKNELQIYQHVAHVTRFVDMNVTSENEYRASQLMLEMAVTEMKSRNRRFSQHPARPQKLIEARELALSDPDNAGDLLYPYLFILIEECSSYMSKPAAALPAETKKSYQSMIVALEAIARMGRSAGIHLITATQYPTVDQVSRTLKQQSRRIGLRTVDRTASMVIIDQGGLELLKSPGRGKITAPSGRYEHFRGLWLRKPDDSNPDLQDERGDLVNSLPFTNLWPKLPDDLTASMLVTPNDDATVHTPERRIWHQVMNNTPAAGAAGRPKKTRTPADPPEEDEDFFSFLEDYDTDGMFSDE